MSKIDWTAEPRVSLEGEIDRLAALVEEQRAENERLKVENVSMRELCGDRQKWRSRMGLTCSSDELLERAEAAEQEIGRLKIRNGELASEVLTGALPILKKLEAAERALADAERERDEARQVSISPSPTGGALLVWHIGGRYLEAEVPSDQEEGVIEWMFERGPNDFIHWNGGSLNEAVARALAERSES